MAAGVILLILEGATTKGLLLLMLLTPFYYLGAEILARRIRLDDSGVTISKLLRSVRMEWSHIQSVEAVKTGRKVFLILQPRQGMPAFITNTVRPFRDLVNRILEKVGSDKISENARELLTDPPPKHGPMIQAWIVCLVLTGLLAGKILGYA